MYKAKFVNNQLWVDENLFNHLLEKFGADERDGKQYIHVGSYFSSNLVAEKMNGGYYKVVPAGSQYNERPVLQLEAYWDIVKFGDVKIEGNVPTFYRMWFANRGVPMEDKRMIGEAKMLFEKRQLPDNLEYLGYDDWYLFFTDGTDVYTYNTELSQAWPYLYKKYGLSDDDFGSPKFNQMIKKAFASGDVEKWVFQDIRGKNSLQKSSMKQDIDKLRKQLPKGKFGKMFVGENKMKITAKKLNESPDKRKKIKSYKGFDVMDLGDDVITVAKPGAHWSKDFIIGLDDSKIGGNRRSVDMTRKEKMKAAEKYIDWRSKNESIKEILRPIVKKVMNEYGGRNWRAAGSVKGDPRVVTVKYPTKCAETGKPLKKGDKAVYYPKSKKLYCMDSKQAYEFRNWKMDMDMGYNY